VLGGGELTGVVLYVVDLESRGPFIRFDDLPVEFLFLTERTDLYGDMEVVVDVRAGRTC